MLLSFFTEQNGISMHATRLEKRRFSLQVLCQYVLILLGTLSSTFSIALDSNTPTLSIVTEDLPPYQFLSSNGELKGYSFEVVNLLLEEAGEKPTISTFPWARAYKIASTTKNTAIFSVAKNAARLPHFHWVGKLHSEKYIFITLKSNHHIKVENLDQVKQYTTAVTRSNVTDQLLTRLEFPNIERTASFDQSLHMLLRKRVDLVIATREALKYYHFSSNIDLQKLTEVYQLKDHSSDIYFAINIASDQALVDRLKEAFKKIESDGHISSLRKKWGMDNLNQLSASLLR